MTLSLQVKDIPFLNGLPKDLIQQLADHFEIRALNPGKEIINFGEPVSELYLILKGNVSVYTRDGGEKIATLGHGASIGEMSLFEDQQIASANVCAGDKGVSLLIMPKSVIEEKVLSNETWAKSFYFGMCQLLSSRLRTTNLILHEKVTDIKNKIKSLLSESDILEKVRNSQKTVESLGEEVFKSLANIIKIIENEFPHMDEKTLKSFDTIKDAVERVLLVDLQDVDRITQKLDLALQYIENIERSLNNQELNLIRGDRELFNKVS